jgi:hypothetical protein
VFDESSQQIRSDFYIRFGWGTLHYNYIFYPEVSCHPTIMIFPNLLRSLAWWDEEIAQMAQQPILNMEINENYVFAQHMVGLGEVRISLVELRASKCLMAT